MKLFKLLSFFIFPLVILGSCASPQNTPVDPNQAVTAFIALDNLDANVDSLEVIVKPNTDFVAKVPNAGVTRVVSTKTRNVLRLSSFNGQAAESVPVIELKDMLPSTYQTSITGIDDETGVVLFESNGSLEIKPQPSGTGSPTAGSFLRVQGANQTPNTSTVELERATTTVQVRAALPNNETELNYTASIADAADTVEFSNGELITTLADVETGTDLPLVVEGRDANNTLRYQGSQSITLKDTKLAKFICNTFCTQFVLHNSRYPWLYS